MPPTGPRFLDLPSEIRLQIWNFAFGNSNIALHERINSWPGCDECLIRPPLRSSLPIPPTHETDKLLLSLKEYNAKIAVFRTNRIVFAEAFPIFLSSLTLHVDDPDLLRRLNVCGPASLRQNTTKVIIYIHLSESFYRPCYKQMYQITDTLPKLRHLRINYHMRPPISYENLLDSAYLTVPLLQLSQPLSPPLFVVKDEGPSSSEHTSQMEVDSKPGTCIYTAYMKQEVLFDAHFLGDITTEDAIDEHTAVIRALFHDPDYTAAARVIQLWADPGRVPDLQQALLIVARRYERPWFEKLQRRRMIQFYIGRGWSAEDAESHLDRQLAELSEGEGIEVLVENLMQEEMSFEEFIA